MPSSPRRPNLWRAAPLALLLAAGGAAAALSGADAAKERIAHMKGMGAAAKVLTEELKSGAPDAAIVKVQTAKIAASAKALPTWFPAGSGPESGVKTRALPLIWSQPSQFAAKAQALAAAADKLNAVAQAGDMAGVGPATSQVGAACKSCHEVFQAKEKG